MLTDDEVLHYSKEMHEQFIHRITKLLMANDFDEANYQIKMYFLMREVSNHVDGDTMKIICDAADKNIQPAAERFMQAAKV